jgi:hypothetical protein
MSLSPQMARHLHAESTMRTFDIAEPSEAQEASLEYVISAAGKLTAEDTARDIATMSNALGELEKRAEELKEELKHDAATNDHGFFGSVGKFFGDDSGADHAPRGGDATEPQPNQEFPSLFLRMVDSVAQLNAQEETMGRADQLADQNIGSHGHDHSDAGSIFEFMIEYQKMMSEEAREDHKIERADHELALAGKDASIDHDNATIEQQVHEANEKYDTAMSGADAALITGIVSGAVQIADGAATQAADGVHVVNDVSNMYDQMEGNIEVEYEKLKQDAHDNLDDLAAKLAELTKEHQLHQDNAAIDQGVHEASDKADTAMNAATVSMILGVVAGVAQIASGASSMGSGHDSSSQSNSGSSHDDPPPHFELVSTVSDFVHHLHL